jgi:triosephosphate isomerase
MKYIIGNWKSHKNLIDVNAWCDVLKKSSVQLESPTLSVVLCPSFVHLPIVKAALPDLFLGVQTLSPFPDGSYTGAVSARMAADFAKFALLGHVERRKYFAESDQIVANQAQQAVENELTPIIAVAKQNWSSQLSLLSNEQLRKVIVMYEPPEAISTSGQGHAADLNAVKEVITLIKNEYPVKAVLYGGSVDSHNIQNYIGDDQIDGVVPGAASLDAAEFIKMITIAQSL